MEQEKTEQFSFLLGMIQQLNDLFGGRESEIGVRVFVEFSQVFLNTIDERMGTLATAARNKDHAQIHLLSHQLRGSLRTLGAHTLADTCMTMEDGARLTADMDYEGKLEEMTDQIPVLKSELAAFLRTLPSTSAPPEG
ncbi:MAG: hypothetical protein C5B49_05315 [Bdellovibrio sp.]|nr:MAG: hypothetical protein C5B49_05315 [Bdellovibrio sp.]